ncbi:cytoplasmic protein [Apiospora kogelbergensis]|uniref:Cytoplasmic protein n=1 Tax=Apiospora kogelbergensis TaxID=1337665 RepID=A0AAW0QM67_9PEZI
MAPPGRQAMQFQHDGKTLFLRGVNLADAKFPPGRPTYLRGSLDDAEKCSYIDAPLELKRAPEHLERLRYLGYNVLRLPVPWEALEHAGPGIYDDEYIDYIRQLVEICNKYGFKVIINPHQDLWSRHAGGSGAPLWTLHACGLDPDHFGETHAAIRYCEWPLDEPDPAKKDPKSIPPMMWTTNHNRLASCTIFALFYGGRDFAPRCNIVGEDGVEVNIQDYLQRRYYAAYARLAEKLGNLPFGYDGMNEPEPGYIGWQDLNVNEREHTAKIHSNPTPIQGMRLAMGQEQREVQEFRLGQTEDPRWPFRRSESWPLGTCVWALHGVWDVETGELKCPDYFAHLPHTSEAATKKENKADATPFTFVESYWREFHRQWTESVVRAHSAKTVSFMQPCVFSPLPAPSPPASAGSNAHPKSLTGQGEKLDHDQQMTLLAYSPHFYDGLTVMRRHWHESWNADVVGLIRGHYKFKAFGLRVGKGKVRKVISDQIGQLAQDGADNGVPTLIGETGIPFNLDGAKAYRVSRPSSATSSPAGSPIPSAEKQQNTALSSGTSEEGKGGGNEDSEEGGEGGGGDYTAHVKAMDALVSACDDHLVNFTLWAYSAVNTHEWGDGWNGEDLSLYCDETGSFPSHPYLAGARAPAAWCRPFVQTLASSSSSSSAPTSGATRARLVRMAFDLKTSRFEAEVDMDGGEKEEEAIATVYVPWLHYRQSDEDTEQLALQVQVADGDAWEVKGQVLTWRIRGGGGRRRLELERQGGVLSPRQLGTIIV